MKRMLIVSPTFLPATSADMQRVRMMLPHLTKNGWSATILSANPASLSSPKDPLLEKITGDAHQVLHYDLLPTSKFGIRNLGLRSISPIKKLAAKILKDQQFDCAFFSNTMFACWKVGPIWLKKYDLPYFLDFQDPWWRFEPRGHKDPGHPFKSFVARTLARMLEPNIVKQATGIITVSPRYNENLLNRYPSLSPEQILHIPFSSALEDFELCKSIKITNNYFDGNDGLKHFVYVGRLGEDMVPALNALFRNFKSFLEKEPETAKTFRFHFIGTSYASGNKKEYTATPLALNWSLLDYVFEFPERVPYSNAIQALLDSDAVLILGSTDSAYSPSKLFPALISEKPILCLAAKDSTLSEFLKDYKVPALLWDYTYSEKNDLLFKEFIEMSPTKLDELYPILRDLVLSDKMTAKICNFFDTQLEHTKK